MSFETFEFAYYEVWHCTASIKKINVKLYDLSVWHFIRRKIMRVYLQLSAEGIKTCNWFLTTRRVPKISQYSSHDHSLETRKLLTLQLSAHRVDDCRSIQPPLLSIILLNSSKLLIRQSYRVPRYGFNRKGHFLHHVWTSVEVCEVWIASYMLL